MTRSTDAVRALRTRPVGSQQRREMALALIATGLHRGPRRSQQAVPREPQRTRASRTDS